MILWVSTLVFLACNSSESQIFKHFSNHKSGGCTAALADGGSGNVYGFTGSIQIQAHGAASLGTKQPVVLLITSGSVLKKRIKLFRGYSKNQ